MRGLSLRGVTVQVGPRRAGRSCAGWGQAIARERVIVFIVLAGVVANVALALVMLSLNHAAQGQVPAIFTPTAVPSVFCPAGQHVTGVSASGWPDCAANH
jgi:hypothetical protein